MTELEKLIEGFERFPGIGSRQARRFAFHILTLNENERVDLAEIIATIGKSVRTCTSCFRFFSTRANANLCSLCESQSRDKTKILVVERDSDIDSVEKSGTYDGRYFVFGGTIPLLSTAETKKYRGTALKRLVELNIENGLKEIILGFSVNPDGENTVRYIEMLLSDTIKDKVKLSQLGRGLSTGSELEYADQETIKNAFKNRE